MEQVYQEMLVIQPLIVVTDQEPKLVEVDIGGEEEGNSAQKKEVSDNVNLNWMQDCNF
jgi:hypothetical protein